MTPLPSHPQLGDLEIVEVYEYYDRPVLFAARNQLHHLYLITLAESAPAIDKWLCVAITWDRLAALTQGSIDLSTAFRNPEGPAFLVNSAESSEASLRSLRKRDILEQWLPMEGELAVPSQDGMNKFVIAGIRPIAAKNDRLAVDFRLSFKNFQGYRAPARPLGRLIALYQDVIEAVLQSLIGEPTEKGILPQEIAQLAAFDAIGTMPGSFRLQLVARVAPELFSDESSVEGAVQALGLVMLASEKPEAVREAFSKLGLRAASRYKVFLEQMVANDASVSVGWVAPRGGRFGFTNMTHAQAAQALETLSAYEVALKDAIYVNGKLIGANLRLKTFEILEVGSDRKYSGRIADEGMQVVDAATLGRLYTATLLPSIEVDATTGAERTSYQLLNLTAMVPPGV